MTLGVGIVGMGAIAQQYLAAIGADPRVRLLAACDLDPTRLESLPNDVARCASLGEMLTHGDLTGVIVTLPNHLHYEACAAALDAGRHVCCEKPLTIAVAESESLIEKAAARGLTLMTALHRRHNRHFLDAARALRDSPRPARVIVRYLEDIDEHAAGDGWYLDPRACGGGCLADNGPNAIGMVRELLGELSIERALVEREVDGVEMASTVWLRSRADVSAKVELSWDYAYGERKELCVEWPDGERLHVDLLDGFVGLKASLAHEYVGLLDEFATRQTKRADVPDHGAEIVRLIDAAYAEARRASRSPEPA